MACGLLGGPDKRRDGIRKWGQESPVERHVQHDKAGLGWAWPSVTYGLRATDKGVGGGRTGWWLAHMLVTAVRP